MEHICFILYFIVNCALINFLYMKTLIQSQKVKLILLGFSLVITLFCSPLTTYSQSVTIKDSKFEKALVDLKLDKDGLNGSLKISDVDTVTRLVITNKGITDLAGLEVFKSLLVLNCDSNQISYFRFINMPSLVEVHCAYNKFIGLDFSYNKALRSLDCRNNLLNSLNISNGFSDLFTYFNAKGNSSLTQICVDNMAHATANFTSIDGGVAFNDVDCKTGNIPDLNFETALILQKVDNNGLTGTVNLKDVDGLTILNIKNAGISDLKGIEYFSKLKLLNCSGNYIRSLDIKNFQQLTDLNCLNNKISTLDVSHNKNLVRLNCSFNDMNTLLIDSNNSLKNLNCEYNKINTLNLENFSGLDTLICDNNQISDLILLSQNLTYLDCSNNKLTSINVMFMSKLTDLLCSNNSLKNLNFSGNTSLKSIFCYYNSITIMLVANVTELTQLYCDFNNLSYLDLSTNAKLKELNCKNNNLTKLNIKNGNNKNMTTCISYYNDNLKTICTDDAKYAILNFPQKPSGAVYLDGNCINTSTVSDFSFSQNKIYPNPFKGSFTIDFENNIDNLSIYNALGQVVDFTSKYTINKVEIFIETPGIFILSYKSGDKHFQSKIISY